ncbi:hypothetical protein A2303_07345 [Candidatus Falkowbacteria bacterium RIFOXYB2_FULL_47_14]|uniref:PhoU domain-containing protein n=1 Tax=Candidatus Falkowbacteria bacterium RIFOXYA2_FULL_47_19 TaxID=1797994 RepID=A0A1F5SGE8_9BACT|nr:MAG: hypothetical protein A2227_01095 [Candidatus Falkowbacteria bacterium RIFOXYA2_FULL_47_19]OGF34961.1 MAG: hypothetical protein A2468_07050 [Candidatus Falkowbacteria bacterium RIFOXYC2_FULL_46_15]OGF43676.1 MAG: hypothetical protein A2303_07345 [Candidatus Falkowbacteria bacterium RIFOXYB2_FULL_47_14]
MKKLFAVMGNRCLSVGIKFKEPLASLLVFFVLFNLFSPLLYYGQEYVWKKLVLFNMFFGGLALFLTGLEYMSRSLQKCAGESMRSVLSAITTSPGKGLLAGGLVTAIIQTSAGTIIILLSFVQARMMTFVQTLGVILGADIGTTITAWLVSMKISGLPWAAIGLGFLILAFRGTKIKYLSMALICFGALFLGIEAMSAAMKPLQNDAHINSFVHLIETPYTGWALGILLGASLTAATMSSSATTGMVVVLASSGLITLGTAVPFILGTNIGSCLPIVIASVKYSRDAKRVALAHVLFKVAGVALFFFFIPQFIRLTEVVSIRLVLSPGEQAAAAHTIFNVIMSLAFLPFIKLAPLFPKIVYRLLPIRENEKEVKLINTGLDVGFIKNSMTDTALDQVRKRTVEMLKLVNRMLSAIIIPFISDEKFIRRDLALSFEEREAFIKAIPKEDEEYPGWTLLEGITRRENAIDEMEQETKEYLLKIIMQELKDESSAVKAQALIIAAEEIEAIGDIIHRIMLSKLLKEKKRDLRFDFSLEGKEELMLFHSKICKQLKRMIGIIDGLEVKRASQVFEEKRIEYKNLENALQNLHLARLKQGRIESRETDELHKDLFAQLKQINYHIMKIAKTIHDAWKDPANESRTTKEGI